MLLDSKSLSLDIYKKVKEEAEEYKRDSGKPLKLCFIQAGENPGTQSYVKSILNNLAPLGIICQSYQLPANVTMAEFARVLEGLNANEDANGILVLKPLPAQIDAKWVDGNINPNKDVDGTCPLNLGKVMLGDASGLCPCTPEGVMELLDHYGVELKGKNVVIINNSDILGKPLAMMMTNRFATVTLCHVFTEDLAAFTKEADIIVTGAGVYGLVKPDMIKEGCVLIDVAMAQKKDANGEFVLNELGKRIRTGDALEECAEVAGMITSATPGCGGGTGPLTTAVLAQNLVKAAKLQQKEAPKWS